MWAYLLWILRRKIPKWPQQKFAKMCRTEISSFCINLFVNKLLAAYKGECKACKNTFSLQDAEDHVTRCEEINVSCDLCHRDIRRGDLHNHADVCDQRLVKCVCGETVSNISRAEHEKRSCPFTAVGCPLECGETVKK